MNETLVLDNLALNGAHTTLDRLMLNSGDGYGMTYDSVLATIDGGNLSIYNTPSNFSIGERFTTATADLATPVLFRPLNNSFVNPFPIFQISNSTNNTLGSVQYNIEIAKDEAFTDLRYSFPNRIETVNTTNISPGSLIDQKEVNSSFFMVFEDGTSREVAALLK